MRPFFDTNILVYAFSADEKAASALLLLRTGGYANVQVLNEFVNVQRRKQRLEFGDISKQLALIHDLVSCRHPVTIAEHREALRLAERHGFSIFDSLIIAAALALDCDTLYSEDLQHDQIIDGRLRIVNPFAPVA